MTSTSALRVLPLCWLSLNLLGAAAAADTPASPSSSRCTYAISDPGAVMSMARLPGQSACFQITGATTGTVWGSDTYTADSHLPTAAVHAGLLGAGEQGVVRVVFVSGQQSYEGSTRHGVTTHPFGAYGSGYRLEAVAGAGEVVGAVADPGAPNGLRDPQPGNVYYVYVTGRENGGIWGTEVYTADSPLAVAAVHAGLVAVGQTAVVEVRLQSGQASYEGSTRHGITSAPYGAYELSYSLRPVRQ